MMLMNLRDPVGGQLSSQFMFVSMVYNWMSTNTRWWFQSCRNSWQGMMIMVFRIMFPKKFPISEWHSFYPITSPRPGGNQSWQWQIPLAIVLFPAINLYKLPFGWGLSSPKTRSRSQPLCNESCSICSYARGFNGRCWGPGWMDDACGMFWEG